MWEIYSTFAPKPLMLSSGKYDDLFPVDLFRKTVRKVRAVYEKMGAGDSFNSAITYTKHSWEAEDITVISDFFCHTFGVFSKEVNEIGLLDVGCRFVYPDDAISTNMTAERILGEKIDNRLTLPSVYPPILDGKCVEKTFLAEELFLDDPMLILSQMEFAHTK